MKATVQRTRVAAQVQAEAERRFVRQLARDCPPEERAALAEWITAAPAHAQAYESVRRTWKQLAALKQDPDLTYLRTAAHATAAKMRGEHHPSRFTRAAPWVGGAMAAGLMAAAVWWSGMTDTAVLPNPFSPTVMQVASAELETAVGELRTEVLADGSAVTLNTGTEMEADLTHRQRDIRLKKGEALFDVKRDTQRPFVVAVGADTVTALGTRFQVRQIGADESVVTLIEGSVRVRRANGSSRVLEPGERALLDRLGGIIVSRVDAEEVVSWARGWLVFRNEPLARAVAEVNRYADRPIRLEDPALGSLRLSGNFRVGDSTSMASAMAAILPLRVAEVGDGLELRLAGGG